MNQTMQRERVLEQVREAVTASEVASADAAITRYREAYPEEQPSTAWEILWQAGREADRRHTQAQMLGISAAEAEERETLVRDLIHLLRRDAAETTFLESLSQARRAVLSWQERFPADILAEEMLQTLQAREREALLLIQMQHYFNDSKEPALA